MTNQFIQSISEKSLTAAVIISIAMMLFAGFLMTRITKRLRLPNVTAYILTGILLGPYCLKMVPQDIIDGMDFLSDIAVAFIAFGAGEFFRFSALKKNGMKIVVITLLETCTATVVVFILTYGILRINLVFSIMLSALAAATAPASTLMTIRQTGARGDFVDTLLQVIALDDVVGLLEYSVAISLALAFSLGAGHISAASILRPVVINLGVLLLGGLFGLLLKLLMTKRRTEDNRLIISISLLFAFCGICVMLDVSPLLGCMSMGMIYVNLTDNDRLFKQLNYFTPPILLLFFVRSGLNFRLDALFEPSGSFGSKPLFVIGILYFAARIAGKYFGAFLGCLITKKKKEVRNYLGFALIPQASVAIGLAAMGARALGGEVGVALQTVILTASLLYELVGPALAKLSLYLSGSYSDKLEDIVPLPETGEDGKQKTAAELLIERIRLIQEELPREPVSPEEEAFMEAAEEQMAMRRGPYYGGFFRNRRRS